MASLESINSFEGGMNSDNSKFIQQPNTYLDALNFRLVTELGQSNRALVNIKGNEYKTTIQDTYAVYKIIVGTFNIPVTITINGVTSLPFTTNSSTLGFDIYNVLSAMSNFNVDFQAAYYQDHTTIWSETMDPNPTLSSAGLLFDTQYAQIGTNYWIAPQSNLIPIGSTYIRDDIYVFTTPTFSIPSSLDNAGQIYKLTYDVITKVATLKLIYNGYVRFDILHPIPPTGTHGRYENTNIQRLYWTDNYNKLRSVNAMDANLMAFPVALLDIFPQTKGFIPTLDFVDTSGNLAIGVYQYAYRLKKSNGQVTLWSSLSMPIIVPNVLPEAPYINGAGNWSYYIGNDPITSALSGKAVHCVIGKVDSTFDFIDVAFVYRTTYNDPGLIEIFNQNIPVNGNNPIKFVHTGNELNNVNLTLQEFLATSPGFTHCKTIDTKDNRLFVGNVRVEQEDLVFDARAYQFPTGQVVTSIVNGGVVTNETLATLALLPETNDAINYSITSTFYNSNGALPLFAAQRFYPGTSIPGGKGPHVEFKVKSFGIQVDKEPQTNFNVGFLPGPWRSTTSNYWTDPLNFGVDKEDFPHKNPGSTASINDSMKTVYKAFLLRGYTPNEIYRFGIQFYDKQGSPYFTKWCCDIIMPDYEDEHPGGRGYNLEGTPLTFGTNANRAFTPIGIQVDSSGANKAYMQIPYLEFTVDVSSIEDKISGFEIVRVERTEQDRFIAGTGVLTQVQHPHTNGSATLYLPTTRTGMPVAGALGYNQLNWIDVAGTNAFEYRDINYTFDCWDFQTDKTPAFDPNNDTINVCGYIQNVAPYPGSFNGGYFGAATGLVKDAFPYGKFYSWGTITKAERKLVQADVVTYNGSIGVNSGGYTYYNHTDNEPGQIQLSHGNPTLFTEFSAALAYHTLSGANTNKLFGEYRKYNRLPSQYGGNTYINRTNSIYISTGMYVPVDDIQISGTTTPGVITYSLFGGDTFYTIYAKEKNGKEVVNYPGSDIESYIHYVPNIGYHNSELRSGNHIEFPPKTAADNQYSGDNTQYFQVYSVENNIRKFYPKPLLINLTDEWDNRVYYSGIKINGEISDSWESYKPNDYWDVEGSYGPINSLMAFNETLYFVQKKAFGKLYVNPMSIISTNIGQVVTGLGNTIQRHDYLSTDVGTSHQWSVTRSPNSFLFVDSTNKKVIKYSHEGINSISDTYGQKNTFVRLLHDGILTSDNPIIQSGIHCTYDYYHDEYLITLLNKADNEREETGNEYNTISFNEKVDRWNSFYSFTPTMYMNNRTQLWSPDPNQVQDLYIHNIGSYSTFYGVIQVSTVKLLSNPNGKYTKLFNNLIFNTEAIQDSPTSDIEGNINIFDSTFDTFRAYNDYQNTDFLTLVPNGVSPTIRRIERQWNLQVPRNKVLYSITSSPDIFTDLGTKLYGERMRDKYLTIDLSYDNTNDYRLIFHNLQTKYLISDR